MLISAGIAEFAVHAGECALRLDWKAGQGLGYSVPGASLDKNDRRSRCVSKSAAARDLLHVRVKWSSLVLVP